LAGSIYYIFNGDSIAALAADGSHEQLIYVGGAPAELALSPDGTLLAFTAQGAGSAREVFIINLDGSYVQQVSCLGFARVIEPVWSFDSQSLAFAASQTPDGLIGIYAAGIAGSGQCPAGNNQRLLAQTSEENGLTSVTGITWNRAGDFVFFSSEAIYGVSAAGGEYRQMTYPTGYGPDLSPVHSPINDTLFYLKGGYDETTQTYGGQVYQALTSDLGEEMLTEQPGARLFARTIRWSVDGRFLLAATDRDVFVQDTSTNTTPRVFTGGNFFPAPVFSPDAQHIAFIDSGRGTPTIPQIFVITRDGEDRSQISRHQEGSISDLNWAAQ
jgi:Tol biopolymer transport system component